MLKRVLFYLCGMLFYSLLWAGLPEVQWYRVAEDKSIVLNVELFLSSDCPHCHKADDFFKSIEPQNPWLKVHRHLINQDKKELNYFYELLAAQNMDDFAVPSVFFCNSRWMGFVSAETTGKELLASMEHCKQQITKQGQLSPSTVELMKHKANANIFDSSMVDNPSPLHYILVVSMMDAFNPCAFFAAAGFLAFVLTQRSSKKQIVIGSCYLVAFGLIHAFQRVNAPLFYEWFHYARIPALIIGVLGLLALYQSRKKELGFGIFCILAIATAFIVQWYQQTCLMSWSFVFEQWLVNQTVSKPLYQFYFELLYLFPLTLALVLMTWLLKSPRLARHATRLESFAQMIFVIVFGLLIVYPYVLGNPVISLITLIISFFGAWFFNKKLTTS